VVFTDADLSYPPSQVLRLLEGIEAGWDVVVGSRAHADTHTTGSSSRLRAISGRLFNLVTGLVLDRRFGDTQCGLKGFHRDAAQRLFSLACVDGFAFDVEVLWLAGHLGLGVDEVPVELASAEGSTVRLNIDPWRMLRDLWRIRRRAAAGAYGPPAGPDRPDPADGERGPGGYGPPAGAE
jgi:dolichyl-phosphate beta-glucosyltransferase